MSDLIVDPRCTAIVVIDLQRGVVGRACQPHSPAEVVASTVRLLDAGRAAGVRGVFVHVGGAPDGADRLTPVADQPMQGGTPLPPDWSALIPELGVRADDIVVLKRQWGAFYGTDLDLQLRRRGLTTLILAGIATEFGVESTARDAYEHGYSQVFAADAMTGLTEASHVNALTRIFPRIGLVRQTDEILAALRR